MSSASDILSLGDDASEERLALAVEMLTRRSGVVLFEETILLRPEGGHLLCQVLDPISSAHRCANEYEVLVENARRLLDASRLRKVLPRLPKKWSVVEGDGTHGVELWRVP